MYYQLYDKGEGSIVGSFFNIEPGDKIISIDAQLSHDSNNVRASTPTGRYVTAAYWIVDKDFDVNTLKANDTKARYCSNITCIGINNYIKTISKKPYVNTDLIPNNQCVEFKFDFSKYKNDSINYNKIFFAFISANNAIDSFHSYESSTLCVPVNKKPEVYYKDGDINSDVKLLRNNNFSIIFGNGQVIHANDEEDSINTTLDPLAIKCSDISYRTHSQSYSNKSKDGWIDGGEKFDSSGKHVYNLKIGTSKYNTIQSEYDIDMGRLEDVTFEAPEEGGFKENGVINPRWVFKRSRIKFTIPPLKPNSKGNYNSVEIRYKVLADIHDTNKYKINSKTVKAYKNEWVINLYNSSKASDDITIVICPRDEGVLDDTPFRVVFQRRYANSRTWSEETIYYFHTFQKPIINITYPKIIRNKATGTGFKYAKILAGNMYSNFDGEENIMANKYVCDALNVMTASPKEDGSGIPLFTRFFLTEYRFGRNSQLINGGNYETAIDAFKSKNIDDYATKDQILNSSKSKITAEFTSIYKNNQKPLLFCGRFKSKSLYDLGANYNMWTYNQWDKVYNENDPVVPNAWIIKDNNGKVLSDETIKDHYGAPDSNLNNKQDQDTHIIFRAGYIYLLKMRMFHGATAGALERYGQKDYKSKVTLGIGGKYVYGENTAYKGPYPENDNNVYDPKNLPEDIVSDIQLKPYTYKNMDWCGPDDGTTGYQLYENNSYNSKLKETYPGFSEVDYTIFEPIIPYTSTKNLITVHPTSSEIGVNQALSFNYRHLQKNTADIDTFAYDNNDEDKRWKFGKTIGGVSNTVTRIMEMYSSCVESMLKAYRNYTDSKTMEEKLNAYTDVSSACTDSRHSTYPQMTSENITIQIAPLSVDYDDNNYVVRAFPKDVVTEAELINGLSMYSNKQSLEINNPLVYNKSVLNKTIKEIFDEGFYNSSCGCNQFNSYRSNNSNNHIDSNMAYGQWPEFQTLFLIPKDYNTINIDNEPLGNVYRWCPVINAVESNTKEIQIEGQFMDADKFPNNNSQILYNDPKFDKEDSVYEKEGRSIQRKYYFESIDYYDQSINNASNKFFINELSGQYDIAPNGIMDSTTINKYREAASYPVLYTLASNSIKYFGLTVSEQEESYGESYGKLYRRIPASQDCENGDITAYTTKYEDSKLLNTGGLITKNTINMDDNTNNIFPLTRTTHYLYFKTWINTSFIFKVDTEFKYVESQNIEYKTDENGNVTETHHCSIGSVAGTRYFRYYNTVDDTSQMELIKDDTDFVLPKSINFGDSNGFSEVYGEDNGGWGRCLTADDNTARKIKYDGTYESQTQSGGVEVPILIRYTPLLQPAVSDEKIYCDNDNNKSINFSSKSVVVEHNRKNKSYKMKFVNSTGTESELLKANSFDINIYYPYIKENNAYTTNNPDGGRVNAAYTQFNLDSDTHPIKGVIKTNKDIFGGYGICTAYTVLLVPADPDLSNINASDKQYFTNTDGHWNYFKQPANYYSTDDILNVRSKSVPSAGTVIVAKNLNADSMESYLKDTTEKGRANKSININFNYLFNNKYFTNTDTINKKPSGQINNTANKLQAGVVYDLVIVPIYKNDICGNEQYLGNSLNGSINNTVYGGVTSDKDKSIIFAGSNPLVSFNYLQISEIVDDNGGGGGGGTIDPEEPMDPHYILNTDHAIIFPNVNNKRFENKDNSSFIECPGFWLNNSFRLVLRMPSFPTDNSNISVKNMSNGQIDNADDFEFDDIQIHIGKITELESYGYPNEFDTKLNLLTNKQDLAKAHIISYKHYCNSNVFSKKLNNDDFEDLRDKVTAGELEPDSKIYNHRFIEVNLSNAKIDDGNGNLVPIYTIYPEGYYIQFRWKSAYGGSNNSSQWSDWHGGSMDGGILWWGDKGTEYYVPVRNYNDVHTRFRSYIKESFPGSIIGTDSNPLVGQGSQSEYGKKVENATSDEYPIPFNPEHTKYYYRGVGNIDSNDNNESNSTTLIVPSNKSLCSTSNSSKITKSTKLDATLINPLLADDNPYKDEINYIYKHDSNFKIPENITNMHQQMWEMLYIDYIITNMCKLYYMPSKEIYPDISNKNHLAPPYNNLVLNQNAAGWDNMEIQFLNKHLNINDGDNSINFIKNYGPLNDTIKNRDRWDRNKYYRKIISKQDFDELNNHLLDLVNFINNNELAGKLVHGYNDDVLLPTSSDFLDFYKSRKALIGHDINSSCGIGNTNNLTHTLMGSNYLQNIWQNILSITRSSIIPYESYTEFPNQ